MTLLKVYSKNGHCGHGQETALRYRDLLSNYPLRGYGYYSPLYDNPQANIREDKESFTLEMGIPGLSRDQIRIDVDKDVLTVSAQVNTENTAENYTYREFDFNRFNRSFQLPKSVDQEKINATVQNGILRIVLPKKEESIDRGPKNIEIS